MAPHPLVGKEAPAVTLPNQDSVEVTITPGADKKPVAIFFYPASGTYGCTKEACAFRDALKNVEVFQRSSVSIYGISQDKVEKQKEFVDQHGLPYPILSDSKGDARKAYQVEKGMMGLTEGRVTYFIDSKGIVKDVMNSMINFNGHVSFVRKCLEAEEKQAMAEAAERAAEVTA